MLSLSLPLGASARLPLQMGDELADGDLLRHLLVEVVAVEHHGLQDGQGPLQNGGVHAGLVHETRDLKPKRDTVDCSRSAGQRTEGRESGKSRARIGNTGHWGKK